MRNQFLFLIMFAFIAACSSPATPNPIDSGIYGQVTIGPTCPVVRVNNPCPDKPYQATLTILTTTDRHIVLKFQTNADGTFRVMLAPGNYILHPESPSAMPHAGEILFIITSHEFTHVNIAYDSGIR